MTQTHDLDLFGRTARLERFFASQESDQKQTVITDLEPWLRHFLPEHFNKPFSKFHQYVIAQVGSKKRSQKNCYIAPRRAGKSHVVTFGAPLKNALDGQERFQLILSETDGQAAEKIENIRDELQMNPRLRAAYGDLCDPGGIWKKNHLKFKNGCQIMSFGQGGAIRGIKKGADRPSLVILDDTEGEKHVTSPAKRTQGMNWLQKAVLKIGDEKTNFFMIGSAIHPDCMVIQVKKKGWNQQVFPAVDPMPTRMDLWHEWKAIRDNWGKPFEEREQEARAFYEANRADMDAGAVVFWPERFTLYELMTAWADDLGSFNTELQGVPYDPSLAYFDPDYLSGDIWFDQWPDREQLLLILVGLDPSLGATKDSDYQAFIAWAIDRNAQEYVDCWMNREDVPAMARRGVSICIKTRATELVMEANGFQRLLRPDLEREVKAQGIVAMNVYEMVDHLKWDKGTRIESLSTPLNRGKIKFRRNSPGVMMLLDQLREYPFGTHDDGPDCLAMVRNRAMNYNLKEMRGK